MSSFATRVVRIIRLDAPELSGMGQVSQEMQLFMYNYEIFWEPGIVYPVKGFLSHVFIIF